MKGFLRTYNSPATQWASSAISLLDSDFDEDDQDDQAVIDEMFSISPAHSDDIDKDEVDSDDLTTSKSHNTLDNFNINIGQSKSE